MLGWLPTLSTLQTTSTYALGFKINFKKPLLEFGNSKITLQGKRPLIKNSLIESQSSAKIKTLNDFNKNVPHHFLSLLIREKLGDIHAWSPDIENRCLQAIFKNKIIVSLLWVEYLLKNTKIFKDFCYWNWALYLQARNPNVPYIPNKLIKSAIRNPLTAQRKHFWNLVFQEKSEIQCIYTGEMLTIDNYDVEYFALHSFVSQDLIWKIISANKRLSSSKNYKIPVIKK